MELTALSNIFDITYGNSLELNSLEICENATRGINFVSRTAKNNGVSAIVEPIPSVIPFDAGLITVSLGGSVLESFVQPKPFYTGYHVMVLSPKREMSDEEKLFYCTCIESNKYRYNYGRQANRTLKALRVPVTLPLWLTNIESELDEKIKDPFTDEEINIAVDNWNSFRCDKLFNIERGKGPRLNELTEEGSIPFVTSTDQNNGWNNVASTYSMHTCNVITVSRNGSVGEAFYQPIDFASTEDVHIFIPKFSMNVYIALFFVSILRMEKYRYNYGRKWGMKRMNETYIMLPVTAKGEPDFLFMEKFIKSLPYSSVLLDADNVKKVKRIAPKNADKGLSDEELIKKYEAGKINLKSAVKKMIKAPSQSSILKTQRD